MEAFVAALFGLIAGSFLNVVILRRGVQQLGGRSACPRCGHVLAWYDLVPVLSWIAVRGRCRYCETSISIQYPLVEATTAVLFGLIWGAPFPMDIGVRILSCAASAILVAIAAYDMRHTIIPDAWSYAFGACGIAIALFLTDAWDVALFAAGPLAALPLFMLWLVSRGRWMGLGDAKLSLGIGWLLGPVTGLFAVMLAFIIGSLVLVPLMAAARAVTHTGPYGSMARGLTMESEVPFGPFLIASTLLVWLSALYGIDLPALAGW